MLPEVEIVKGIYGDFLCFRTQDLISHAIRRCGVWGEKEIGIALLASEHQANPLILDIGANLGAFSIPVAKKLARAGAIVHAFEAQRIVFQQLCANIILNRLDNVVAHHVALGSRAGMIRIPKIDYHRAENIGAVSLIPEIREVTPVDYSATEFENVAMATVDGLGIEGACTFIKIDVEGYESEVIKGMLGFIEQQSFPPILFEEWGAGQFSGAAGTIVEAGKAEVRSSLAAIGYAFVAMGTEVLAQHPEARARLGFVPAGGGQHRVVRER